MSAKHFRTRYAAKIAGRSFSIGSCLDHNVGIVSLFCRDLPHPQCYNRKRVGKLATLVYADGRHLAIASKF